MMKSVIPQEEQTLAHQFITWARKIYGRTSYNFIPVYQIIHVKISMRTEGVIEVPDNVVIDTGVDSWVINQTNCEDLQAVVEQVAKWVHGV